MHKNICVMEKELLHQAKMKLLRVVSRLKTVEDVEELRQIIVNFYAEKAKQEMDRLWDEGIIDEKTIEQWGKEHMRTPYKHA